MPMSRVEWSDGDGTVEVESLSAIIFNCLLKNNLLIYLYRGGIDNIIYENDVT